ncbi:hypothetical protein BgiBS90_019010 [Biomphalaria glabrata]|nr:hypothetical protein BgiBS90_019010 [Biomphalaria glabrata]
METTVSQSKDNTHDDDIFIFEGGTSEANQESGRMMQIILPEGTIIQTRVFSLETAYEFKEKCLGVNYPCLKDIAVYMCKDSYGELVETKLPDEAEFNGLLDDYEYIRIRSLDNEASASKALKPVVKMKT